MVQPGTFQALAREVLHRYHQGQYAEALDLVRAAFADHPGRAATLTFWAACLSCRLGQAEAALAALREGLARGLWWSATMLQDPDLDLIRDRAAFQEVVAEGERRRQEAERTTPPDSLVLSPDTAAGGRAGQPPPLLLALHGAGRTAADDAPAWEALRRAGLLVALPQSSSPMSNDRYWWPDPGRAARDLAWAWERLGTTSPFDPGRVILAGFSQGATMALRLALEGRPIPARGVLAVAPAVRDPDAFAPLIPPARDRGLRAWFLVGEEDPLVGPVRRLAGAMQGQGFPCRLVVLPGLGHDFPADFTARAVEAVRFLLE